MTDPGNACQNCVHYVQSLVQERDLSFRKTKHGVCAAKSVFHESDNTPGIPLEATRVKLDKPAPKEAVWAEGIVLCTLRIRKNP